MLTAELKLMRGLVNYSESKTVNLNRNPDPQVIDLLNGDFNIVDQSGQPMWTPKLPTLKNGGVRADSAMIDGELLIAGAYGSVIETITVYGNATSDIKRQAAVVSDLMRFARGASEFFIDESSRQPVYLKWTVKDGFGPQYALVYNIDVDMTQFNPFDTGDVPQLTLTIEREPYWRAEVPPGANPKLWWNYYDIGNNRFPGTVLSESELNLIDPGDSSVAPASGTVYLYDEYGVSFHNYFDVEPGLMVGDAPALAMITFTNDDTAPVSPFGLYIARSTATDLFPTDNAPFPDGDRAGNTFNAGDADSVVSSTNLTVSKATHANGILSNGSVVNRYVGNLAYAAGPTNVGPVVFIWNRYVNQHPQKYAAFMRAQRVSGNINEIDFWLGYNYDGISTSNDIDTDPVQLQTNGYHTIYMGIVDFTLLGNRVQTPDGYGLYETLQFRLSLKTNKPSSNAAQIQIWDIVLMPIDEPNTHVSTQALGGEGASIFMDNTHYFSSGHPEPAAMQLLTTGEIADAEFRGNGILLKPGVKNRLYFMPLTNAPVPTATFTVRVHIVPRWHSMRGA